MLKNAVQKLYKIFIIPINSNTQKMYLFLEMLNLILQLFSYYFFLKGCFLELKSSCTKYRD